MNLYERITEAHEALEAAESEYQTVARHMGELEELRRGFAKGSSGEVASLLKRRLPDILKLGSAVVGGGGITALLADPGAFKTLLAGIFGA